MYRPLFHRRLVRARSRKAHSENITSAASLSAKASCRASQCCQSTQARSMARFASLANSAHGHAPSSPALHLSIFTTAISGGSARLSGTMRCIWSSVCCLPTCCLLHREEIKTPSPGRWREGVFAGALCPEGTVRWCPEMVNTILMAERRRL